MASIADYLTEMFNKGRCYRAINNQRSAISAFHKPIEGCRAGRHELVCKVVNACFYARPPQPRYMVMWDVDRVLNHYIREIVSEGTGQDAFQATVLQEG